MREDRVGVSLQLPTEVKKAAAVAAHTSWVSLNQFIVDCVEEALESLAQVESPIRDRISRKRGHRQAQARHVVP